MVGLVMPLCYKYVENIKFVSILIPVLSFMFAPFGWVSFKKRSCKVLTINYFTKVKVF